MNQLMCDQLVDYFNGQMDANEKAAFEDHLEACPSCQEELAEWTALSEDLPYLSDMKTPNDGMKERVLAAVFAEEKKEEPAYVENIKETNVVPLVTKKRRMNWLPLVAAVLLVSLAGNVFLASIVTNQKDEIAMKDETVDQLLAFANMNTVTGEAHGTASLVKEGDETKVIVQASALPKLSNDEVFQVWLIDDNGPVRAGTFQTSSDSGAVVFTLPDDMNKDWKQVAVSHEPDASSETPKGDVLMAADM